MSRKLVKAEVVGRCRWCNHKLVEDDGALVDETGGDVCGVREAQDPDTGTNPPHEKYGAPA